MTRKPREAGGTPPHAHAHARVRKGERVELELGRLDDDGAGVGTLPAPDGAPALEVHVARALPGERVQARVDHVSPHRPEAWATLVTITRESPTRVPTACVPFGHCGGCVLQHLGYPAQLEAKQAELARTLGPALAAAGVAVPAVAASPLTLGYRNKAKYVVGPDRAGRLVLGSYLPRSHDLVDMAGCRVIEPVLETAAVALTTLARDKGAGSLRHVVLRANAAGRVLAVLVAARARDPEVAALGAALGARADLGIAGVVLHVHAAAGDAIFGPGPFVALAGADALEDVIGEVRLHLSAGAFFQVNRDQAARLYAAVRAAAELRATDHVVELYAGVAGISLTLASAAARVTAVEEHPGAVADARASVALNGARNVDIASADAAAWLSANPEVRPDVVIVDPPRKGLAAGVIPALAARRPRAILYVSCNPASLARDLAGFAAAGYLPTRAAAFDLFPHTPHIETLIRLEPRTT